MMATDAATYTHTDVRHDADASSFVLALPDDLGGKAHLDYEIVDGTYNLYHTFVPNEARGMGLGKVLAKAAFEELSKSDKGVTASCSYLVNLLGKPEFSGYGVVAAS